MGSNVAADNNGISDNFVRWALSRERTALSPWQPAHGAARSGRARRSAGGVPGPVVARARARSGSATPRRHAIRRPPGASLDALAGGRLPERLGSELQSAVAGADGPRRDSGDGGGLRPLRRRSGPARADVRGQGTTSASGEAQRGRQAWVLGDAEQIQQGQRQHPSVRRARTRRSRPVRDDQGIVALVTRRDGRRGTARQARGQTRSPTSSCAAPHARVARGAGAPPGSGIVSGGPPAPSPNPPRNAPRPRPHRLRPRRSLRAPRADRRRRSGVSIAVATAGSSAPSRSR